MDEIREDDEESKAEQLDSQQMANIMNLMRPYPQYKFAFELPYKEKSPSLSSMDSVDLMQLVDVDDEMWEESDKPYSQTFGKKKSKKKNTRLIDDDIHSRNIRLPS